MILQRLQAAQQRKEAKRYAVSAASGMKQISGPVGVPLHPPDGGQSSIVFTRWWTIQHRVQDIALLALHMPCLQRSSKQTSYANNMI